MKMLITMVKVFVYWICIPPILGVLFVITPCYTLGQFFHQEELWCGYKGAPPHTEAQFLSGLVTGLLIAFWLQRRSLRAARAHPGNLRPE